MHFQHDFLLRVYPFVLAGVAAEIAWYRVVRREPYPWKETFTSLGCFLLRVPARLLTSVVVGVLAFYVWSLRPFTVPLDTAWGLALLFLGEELAYYWSHRSGHMVRWMWATHVVHHTPATIHFASAYRLGATELLSGGWLFYLPLYFLGFNPLAVAGMLGVNLFYQFWLHTTMFGRLGPLEWVFNTPAHHRVHHASNSDCLDRNFGGILIVFDRMFGTFAEAKPGIALTYGLVEPIGSMNPLKIMVHEWITMARDVRLAGTWRARLTQLFGKPEASLTHATVAPARVAAEASSRGNAR